MICLNGLIIQCKVFGSFGQQKTLYQNLDLNTNEGHKICFVPAKKMVSEIKYSPRLPFNLEIGTLEELI